MSALSLDDPTREDSRICRVEGCNRPKAPVNTVSMVRRFTTCRRHLDVARVEENALPSPRPNPMDEEALHGF